MITGTSKPQADDGGARAAGLRREGVPNANAGSYAGGAASAPLDDLDAGAPEFRARDMRRLNRRALAFLAAIVLLLAALAVFLYRAAATPAKAAKPRTDTLVVPEFPKTIVAPPAPPPAQAVVNPAVGSPVPLAAPLPVPPIPVVPAPVNRQPGLVERRGMPMQGDTLATAATDSASPGTPGPGRPAGVTSHATSARSLARQDALLLRGTFIRCVLQTRIVSDIPGFTSCVVTEPVYSFDGARLLLPGGSKAYGAYDQGPVGERIAVVWDRIVTPAGVNVDMSSPGVDNLGGSGYPGDVDSHWRSRISAAVLISLMSDAFLYEGAKQGPRTNSIGQGGVVVQEPFQSNTAETLQNLANQAVQSSANRRPTLTINQGSAISIYVAKDVDFSDVVSGTSGDRE